MADKQGQYSISDLAPDAAPTGAPATSQAPSKPPKQQGQYSESDLAPNQPNSDYSAVGEFGSTLWNDAKALPGNLWHLGGQMLSHPIDTTVQGVNNLLNLPDTLTDEWMQGHPGRAVAHMGELAAPVAAEQLPGAMSAVADSDAYQMLKAGGKGAVEGALKPVDLSRFGLKVRVPQSVAGAYLGHVATGYLPLPEGLQWLKAAGPVYGVLGAR